MNLTDELEKLAKLRQDGTLTEQEFILAKNKLLRTDSPLPNCRGDDQGGGDFEEVRSFSTAANRYVSFQIAMAVVGFIIALIVIFVIVLPRHHEMERMQDDFRNMPGFNNSPRLP